MPDGFPERGLGSWWEYWERIELALRAKDGIIGVHCPHLPDSQACNPCNELKREWRQRNGLRPMGPRIDSAADAARRMAGLPR